MSNRCPHCGEPSLRERIGAAKHEVSGRTIVIEDDRHTVCESCGEVSYVGDQISEVELRVARRIREQDGLLMPEELKAIRAKYGLTQSEMEDLLSVGKKTWVRWERGKVVQSKSIDTMIRAMDAQPDLVRHLLKNRGVTSEAARNVLEAIDAATEREVVYTVNAIVGNRVSHDVLAEVTHVILTHLKALQMEGRVLTRAVA